MTDAVHQQGGRIFLQLRHAGHISHPDLQPKGVLSVAPSAIAPIGEASTYERLKPYVTPRALETSEIPGIVEQFRQAAENTLKASFDGVEIHGANGYLLDQFLRDGSNQRTDEYGGSIENCARLLLEVTKAVVRVWGANRVGVRLSPNSTFYNMQDSNAMQTFGYVVNRLNSFGLAYLHIIDGAVVPTSYLRDRFTNTLIVNGGYDCQRGNNVLVSQQADLVSFGTLFIANPNLPRRFILNVPLNQIDSTTLSGSGEKGYTDYPFWMEQTISSSA